MRVVVDTNVLVSAVLKDKSVPALAVHWLGRHGGLLKSAETEQQLFAVMARPRLAGLIAPPARDWLHRVMAAAEAVVIAERVVACRDPTDDKFLELAVNGRAEVIVSSDADLLVLNPFRTIPVVGPAAFLRQVAG